MVSRKSSGSIADILSVGFCILAMAIMVMACLNSIELINTKAEIGQVARKYILRMETVGYLTPEDCGELQRELAELGVGSIDLQGTTMQQVSYGNGITLDISGIIYGQETKTENGLLETVFLRKAYPFREVRASTAKN